MTINESYGFPEGTIAKLNCRMPDMLPNDIEISDINSEYCRFNGYRILKFSKDAKYTDISFLTWQSYYIQGIIDINTENCADFSNAFNNDSTKYLPIIDISGAENSDRVNQMFSSYIRKFGIKGICKFTSAKPNYNKPNSAELFQYEGRIAPDWN